MHITEASPGARIVLVQVCRRGEPLRFSSDSAEGAGHLKNCRQDWSKWGQALLANSQRKCFFASPLMPFALVPAKLLAFADEVIEWIGARLPGLAENEERSAEDVRLQLVFVCESGSIWSIFEGDWNSATLGSMCNSSGVSFLSNPSAARTATRRPPTSKQYPRWLACSRTHADLRGCCDLHQRCLATSAAKRSPWGTQSISPLCSNRD